MREVVRKDGRKKGEGRKKGRRREKKANDGGVRKDKKKGGKEAREKSK